MKALRTTKSLSKNTDLDDATPAQSQFKPRPFIVDSAQQSQEITQTPEAARQRGFNFAEIPIFPKTRPATSEAIQPKLVGRALGDKSVQEADGIANHAVLVRQGSVPQQATHKVAVQQGAVAKTSVVSSGREALIQRETIEAASLTEANKEAKASDNDELIAKVAAQFGYEGDPKDAEQYLYKQGYNDDDIKEFIGSSLKSENSYTKIDPSEDQSGKLGNLKIPAELNHQELEQTAQGGACNAIASFAGQLLQDPSKLQSVLHNHDDQYAYFKFPPANALLPYLDHSDEGNKQIIQDILHSHENNVYKVEKTIHEGDLLPSTEPWVNLLLKAAHQHINEILGTVDTESYRVQLPLSVKEENGEQKDISFNILTGEVGRTYSGQDFAASFNDNQLKGKKLQIGHAGHATVLVIKQDGSKIYYDNQLGKEEVKTTVKEFLENKGMTTNGGGTVITVVESGNGEPDSGEEANQQLIQTQITGEEEPAQIQLHPATNSSALIEEQEEDLTSLGLASLKLLEELESRDAQEAQENEPAPLSEEEETAPLSEEEEIASLSEEEEIAPFSEEGQQNQRSRKPNKLKKTKKLKEKYEEFKGTPEKFFGHFVPSVLDLMVPDTGDKGKLEVQLRFPVHPGIFVGGRVLLSSERKEDKELKVNFEGTFQGGGTAGVAAIAGEVGAYFESVGKDSKSVGKQLNYGLYRRFRESHVMPRQFTNKLWGDKSSIKGYEQAENWAAQVEQDVFGEKDDKGKYTDAAKKSYIETGGMGGVLADINAGNIATAKASGQYYEGRRFDQYALDQIKGERDPDTNKIKQGSGVGTTEYVPGIGAQKTKGQGTHRFVLSTSGTFGNLSAGIKLKYDAISKPGSKWTEAGTNKWEVEVEQKTNLPPSVIAQSGLAAKIATPLGSGLVDLARSFAPEIAEKLSGEEKESKLKKLFKKKKKTNSQIAGEITRPLIDIGMQLQQNIPAQEAAFQVARKGSPLLDKTAINFVGSLGIGLNVKVGQEAKPDDQPTLESIKGEGAIYKISTPTVRFADSQITLFELAKRIIQFKYQQAKKMKLEVVGIQVETAFGDKKDQDGNVIGKEWGDWQLK